MCFPLGNMTLMEETESTSIEIGQCENGGTLEIDVGSIICRFMPFFKGNYCETGNNATSQC